MNKVTRLGVPCNLWAAIILASGIVNSTVMVGLAIFTLAYENDEFCKQFARKAIALFALFAVIGGVVYFLDDLVRIMSLNGDGYSTVYNKITYIRTAAEILCYLIFAVKAFLTTGSVSAPAIQAAPKAAPQAAPQAASQAAPVVFCPGCGHKLPQGTVFCEKCGMKVQ